MSEFDEFAEALFGQLEVEIGEEKEITRLAEAATRSGAFDDISDMCGRIQPDMAGRAADLLHLPQNANVSIEYPELDEFKMVKCRKVFCPSGSRGFVESLFAAVAAEDRGGVVDAMRADPAKYLVYSTYAIQYISKITTTYGDYLDDAIFVNRFILSRYPDIILHKMGGGPVERVRSGYTGAAKMTMLEESVHSMQEPLQQANRQAAAEVNAINERLAGAILDMDTESVKHLSEYLQLQAVPDDFPFARKANLFFFLNPDHFLTGQIGPDVMTYTHVEVDPTIEKYLPEISSTYMQWLSPIQRHHAAFSVMEGMAGYAIEHVLRTDPDFAEYSATFSGSEAGSYHTRKDMGRDFVEYVAGQTGSGAFNMMLDSPPTTAELKNPQGYVGRMS